MTEQTRIAFKQSKKLLHYHLHPSAYLSAAPDTGDQVAGEELLSGITGSMAVLIIDLFKIIYIQNE